MKDKFLQILGEAYGSDIAYHETESTIKALLEAMQKAYNLGKSKVNNSVSDDVSVRFLFDFVNEFTDTVIPMEAIEETLKRLNEH